VKEKGTFGFLQRSLKSTGEVVDLMGS